MASPLRILAKSVMDKLAPTRTAQFCTLVEFLRAQPDRRIPQRERLGFGSEAYLEALAKSFLGGRSPKMPSLPKTVTDPMIGVVLQEFYGLPRAGIPAIVQGHNQSMAAENFVGHLLESYLAFELEKLDWVWCSGTVAKSIDFIKPVSTGDGWQALQVKNRDNSENSSSKAVRDGTTILHWFRTFASSGETNWSRFPDLRFQAVLSEANFEKFVRSYLRKART